LRTSIRHPTYFGRVSFALSQEHVPNALDDDDTGSGPSNPLKIPVCTDECDLCSGKVPGLFFAFFKFFLHGGLKRIEMKNGGGDRLVKFVLE